MSSAEAELFSLTQGASMSLGMISVARDLGLQLSATVHSDASAALAIAQRQGLGKLRHLKVQYLWVQERIKCGDLGVAKVLGKQNPADLLTKHLHYAEMTKHVQSLSFELSMTRAGIAPRLHDGEDRWEYREGGQVVMHHVRPRQCLFTPIRVGGAPPARSLTGTRITTGRYCDTGDVFTRRDNWTAGATAHLSMSKPWVGKTAFLLRSLCDDH